MIEGKQSDAGDQSGFLVSLDELSDELRVAVAQFLGNPYQAGVSAEQGAGHREKRLDFDVAGGPVADDADGIGFEPGAPVLDPIAVERTRAELFGDDRLQRIAPQPEPQKRNTGEISSVGFSQRRTPRLENIEGLVGRDRSRIDNPAKLRSCGCDVFRNIDIADEVGHRSTV